MFASFNGSTQGIPQLNPQSKEYLNQKQIEMKRNGRIAPTPAIDNNLSIHEITDLQNYLEQLKLNRLRQYQEQPPNKSCYGSCRVDQDREIQNIFHRQALTGAPTPTTPGLPLTRQYGIDELNNRELPVPVHNLPSQTKQGKRTDYYQNSQMNQNSQAYQNPQVYQQANQNPQTYQNAPNQGIQMFTNKYDHGAPQQEFGMITRGQHIGPYELDNPMMQRMGMNEEQFYGQIPNGIRNIDVESNLRNKEIARQPRQSGLAQVEVNRFENLPWDPQDTRHIVFEDNMPRGGLSTRVDRFDLA